MKSTILSLLVVFTLGLAASQAFAFSGPVVANVPFSFTVQNKTLPAGRYRIERVWSANNDVLMIRSEDNGHARAIFTSEPDGTLSPQKQTELVFDKIGNHYFLREIWTAGDSAGRAVPEVKAEKEARSVGMVVTHHSVLAKG